MCFVPIIRYACGHYSTLNEAPYVMHTRLCSRFIDTGDCPGSNQDARAGFIQYPLQCNPCAKTMEDRWKRYQWQKIRHFTITVPRAGRRSRYLVNLIIQATSQAYRELLGQYHQAIEERVHVPWRAQMNAMMARATREVTNYEAEWEDLPEFEYTVYQGRLEQIWREVDGLMQAIDVAEGGDVGGLLERLQQRGISRGNSMAFLASSLADILEQRRER